MLILKAKADPDKSLTMAAAFTRKLGSLLANYSLSTLTCGQNSLLSPFPATSLLLGRFLSLSSCPYVLVCVLSTAGQKAQHGGPLPPLNPAHTGGERAAEGLLFFVLPGRGPELQSASEVVPLLSVRVNMLSRVLKSSESRFISLETELKCEVSRINSDTDHEGRYL